MIPAGRKCRVCGCMDDKACFGGCHWVEPDLCSHCVGLTREDLVLKAREIVADFHAGAEIDAYLERPLAMLRDCTVLEMIEAGDGVDALNTLFWLADARAL